MEKKPDLNPSTTLSLGVISQIRSILVEVQTPAMPVRFPSACLTTWPSQTKSDTVRVMAPGCFSDHSLFGQNPMMCLLINKINLQKLLYGNFSLK